MQSLLRRIRFQYSYYIRVMGVILANMNEKNDLQS